MRKVRVASALALALALALGNTATAHPDDMGGLSPVDALSWHHQHGEADGHLPPVQRNVELVGKLDLFEGQEQPGRIADVAAFGNYAYLGAFAQPNCENTGVYVIDIADPSTPREVGFIPASPSAFVGEGVQVLDMKTASFEGQVLIHNNETCLPGGGVLLEDPRLGLAGPGGASLWDVTDPLNPQQLAAHVGDTDLSTSGLPHNSHSAFGWQQGDKAYMVLVDNGEFATTDIDVFDITDPRDPVLVAETGMDDFPQIQETPPPNGNNAFIHDFVVKKVGDRYLFLGSYWDGGYIILDFTDLPDTTFLRDTDFGVEPFRSQLGLPEDWVAEGNAHQAEFNHDSTLFLGADEDFGPFRFLGTITSGRYQGDTFTGTEGSDTPPIDPDEGLVGPTEFIGDGCLPVPPTPTGGAIALTERGTCTFTIKVQNAQNAGYDGIVVFNDAATDAPNCEAQVFMLAIGNIPSVFVSRSTGLKLLNQDVAANSCDSPSPLLGAPSEGFSMKGTFDGWGYLHLYDANTMKAIDHWALPESLDESKARGFGDLSIHEVAMDPAANRVYLSHYSGGFRVVEFDRKRGIREVGAFIAEGGNNFWGVEVHKVPTTGEQLVLASDRDSGLWIFRYAKGAGKGGKGKGGKP
jgi:hypothetical protein